MHFDFETYGEKQVLRGLERFEGRLVNSKPVFRTIGEHMMDIINEQFRSEGKRSTGGWAPLKESTIEAKGHAGILVDSGDLFRSLTRRGDRGNIFTVQPNLLRLGTTLDYAVFHQKGTNRMPQRKIIEFTEVDRRHFMKIIQRYMVTGEIQRMPA